MAILIDPPYWPAHGRLWSHLVSDTSVEELHAFAERLGIPKGTVDSRLNTAKAKLRERRATQYADLLSIEPGNRYPLGQQGRKESRVVLLLRDAQVEAEHDHELARVPDDGGQQLGGRPRLEAGRIAIRPAGPLPHVTRLPKIPSPPPGPEPRSPRKPHPRSTC